MCQAGIELHCGLNARDSEKGGIATTIAVVAESSRGRLRSAKGDREKRLSVAVIMSARRKVKTYAS